MVFAVIGVIGLFGEAGENKDEFRRRNRFQFDTGGILNFVWLIGNHVLEKNKKQNNHQKWREGNTIKGEITFIWRIYKIQPLLSNKMQNLQHLHEAIKSNEKLKLFVKFLSNVCSKLSHLTSEDFCTTKEYNFILSELKRLHLEEIINISEKLPPVQDITAFFISKSDFFVLVFIMIPEGKQFLWHDHPKMNGFSKCIFGEMSLRALDIQKLVKNEGKITYPTNQVRVQSLTPEMDKSLSIIYPSSFNIHNIKAEKQSGFLDFLIPNYPDKVCTAFKTVSQNQTEIEFEQMPPDYEENIIPFSKYIQSHQSV